jgi:hypothetical protein
MLEHPPEFEPDRESKLVHRASRDDTARDGLECALGSAVGPETVATLADLDPAALSSATLVAALLTCRRLVAWVEATEQSVLAALARPGVAVPVDRVVEAARWSAAKPGELAAADRVIDESPDPMIDPRCREAVAHHAARFAAMEVAAALHLSPLTARVRVERARQLVHAFPNTHTALREGRIDMLRASMLADDTALLAPELRGRVESEALDCAGLCMPSQLRARLTRTIIRIDPEGAADRCRTARRDRDVYARPLPNDLSAVTAIMGAEQAASIMWLLNVKADAAKAPDDRRGIGERRADALADIIDDVSRAGVVDIRAVVAASGATSADATDAAAPAGPEAGVARCDRYRPRGPERTVPVMCISVYVSASTLAGADDLPAELSGHGAISPDLARALARAATSARTVVISTDPARGGDPPGLGRRCDHCGCSDEESCGSATDLGHNAYRPGTVTAATVIERDRVCRFPGCRMPARRCDLDHRIPFEAGGATCPCNLQALCRAHHLAKFTGWSSTALADGSVQWTSPLGFRYFDRREDPTAWPITGREAASDLEEKPPF